MNLDEDAELDRILAGADFTEDGAANDESGISPELVGAVPTPTHDASSTQEMAFREGRGGDHTRLGEDSCQGPSLSFSPTCKPRPGFNLRRASITLTSVIPPASI